MTARPALFSGARTVEINLLRFRLRLNATRVTIIFTLMLLGLLWLSTLLVVRDQYHEAEARARLDVQNYSMAFSENALRTLGEADHIMLDIKRQYAALSERKARLKSVVPTLSTNTSADPDLLHALFVVGSDGVVLHSLLKTLPNLRNSQLSERAYFRIHVNNPAHGLYISAPVLERETGSWSIPMSRRLDHADGSFAGVVVAFLNPECLTEFLGEQPIDTTSIMAVLGDDHVVRASREYDVVRPGEVLQLDAYKADASRITLEQPLAGYPLRTLVSLEKQVALGAFQQNTVLMVSLAAIGTALILIFCLVLLYLFRRLFHALNETRMNEERLSLALAASGLGLCDWDVVSGNMTINRDYAHSLGYKPDEFWLNHEKWSAMLHPDDRARVLEELGLYLGGQRSDYTCQYRVRGAHGEWHHVEGNARIVERDASGKPVRVLATQLDVTQSQNAETQLRRLNNTLEARIRDEVAKNRDKDHLMIHQSRMAAMGEMIGNIAHQWRQPLNALALTLANLRDAQRYGDLTPHYLQEQVSFGEELIRTMSATIEDFRNFYRSNRERKRFSVCIAAQKAVSIVQSAYAQQDIDLQFVCLKDGEMMGVENEYTQALLNLLGNSREIIQERGLASGQVQVKVDSNQQEAWITVTDNGQGIALDILPRIFDPYFTTRPKGIGIGLYMSKMIIENNFGGRIEVENTADGAEFRITTPLADAA